MGAKFTKPPPNATVLYQKFDQSTKQWVTFNKTTSDAIEAALSDAESESVFIIDDGENEGDQILFGGDVAQRIGGPFIHRERNTCTVSELRRIAVEYIQSTPSKSVQPWLLANDNSDTINGKPSPSPKTVDAVRLPGVVVGSILLAQYGSSDVMPTTQCSTLTFEVDEGKYHIKGSPASASIPEFSTFHVEGKPEITYVRRETVLDSTASKRSAKK